MVIISDKISLILDTDQLFQLRDPEVQAMLNGDSYRINDLYKKNLELFKDNQYYKFKHIMSGEIKYLNEWMKFYQSNLNDPKSIVIFLRIAKPMLLLKF